MRRFPCLFFYAKKLNFFGNRPKIVTATGEGFSVEGVCRSFAATLPFFFSVFKGIFPKTARYNGIVLHERWKERKIKRKGVLS